METPFMEVIRFDSEDVIATSGTGPVVTGHIWDEATNQLICPNDRSWETHYRVTEIGSAFIPQVRPVTVDKYNGAGKREETWHGMDFNDEVLMDTWYIGSGPFGDSPFIKCGDGK